jgi:DNA-binding NarL/FixJ family response regulator
VCQQLFRRPQQNHVTQALQAGARGYLLRNFTGADLIRAAEAVVGGKSFFGPPVARVMLDEYDWPLGHHVRFAVSRARLTVVAAERDSTSTPAV